MDETMASNDRMAGPERGPATTAPPRTEKLALLYQGVLTAIVRIQAGKQPIMDVVNFRRQMENLLDEIEREALKVGYRNADIQDAHYVVVAFLNESIQRSSEPNRGQFTPLEVKGFAHAVAGEAVFERLKEIRKRQDSIQLSDLLEVYDLCFLLGYEGRYALGGRAELDQLTEDLRAQIERIRGPQSVLSPEGVLPVRSERSTPTPAAPHRWPWIAAACAVFMAASWVILSFVLSSYSQGVVNDILAP